ncbi:IPExxxVDY family protein [Sphingobacterium corticis]|uniref:IPExxxVDY family protein n=1 Tax=Sphingobacterium corticis TaxID=1812823 RepID=A0ABW5NIC4_9SPHI
MSKITFKLETDFDLELDFVLIGISSTLRDYRLCHFVNKHTNLQFTHGKEDYIDHKGIPKEKPRNEMDYHIVYEQKRGKPSVKQHFSTFRYAQSTYDHEYYLISNRGEEGGLLIPEAANFDYFILIKHFIDDDDLKTLIDSLKSIVDILLVKEIDPIILKSKENLIF